MADSNRTEMSKALKMMYEAECLRPKEMTPAILAQIAQALAVIADELHELNERNKQDG